MPEVVEELNENGCGEAIDKQWNPSLISTILQNRLYIGQYSVGEIERHEEEYRIISDDLFQKAQSLRTRFESSESASKPSMGLKRKRNRLNRILDQYRSWIS